MGRSYGIASIATDQCKVLGRGHRIRQILCIRQVGVHDRARGARMTAAQRVAKFMHENEPKILGVSV